MQLAREATGTEAEREAEAEAGAGAGDEVGMDSEGSGPAATSNGADATAPLSNWIGGWMSGELSWTAGSGSILDDPPMVPSMLCGCWNDCDCNCERAVRVRF